MKRLQGLVTVAVALMAAACASDATVPRSALAASTTASDAVETTPVNRRQYYDGRYERYYFYDPVAGMYYWEDGRPRL